MLEDLGLDFAGRTFTADAPLTQRKLAAFPRARGTHFVFTAKGNQPTLLDDLRTFFDNRAEPDFREPTTLQHGRLESRAIRTTSRLNGYLNFPHVGQAFLVERTATEKKSGKTSVEHALGITSHRPDTADPRQRLRRGSPAHPNRTRTRQHHPPAPLRHRRHPLPLQHLRRRRQAPTRPQPQARLRLPANDRKRPWTPQQHAPRA